MGSKLLQFGVRLALQNLAESTVRLSDEIKTTEPGIDWSSIRDFRNVLTHGYLSIDLDLVWEAVEELPELSEAVGRMKEAIEGPPAPPRPKARDLPDH